MYTRVTLNENTKIKKEPVRSSQQMRKWTNILKEYDEAPLHNQVEEEFDDEIKEEQLNELRLPNTEGGDDIETGNQQIANMIMGWAKKKNIFSTFDKFGVLNKINEGGIPIPNNIISELYKNHEYISNLVDGSNKASQVKNFIAKKSNEQPTGVSIYEELLSKFLKLRQHIALQVAAYIVDYKIDEKLGAPSSDTRGRGDSGDSPVEEDIAILDELDSFGDDLEETTFDRENWYESFQRYKRKLHEDGSNHNFHTDNNSEQYGGGQDPMANSGEGRTEIEYTSSNEPVNSDVQVHDAGGSFPHNSTQNELSSVPHSKGKDVSGATGSAVNEALKEFAVRFQNIESVVLTEKKGKKLSDKEEQMKNRRNQRKGKVKSQEDNLKSDDDDDGEK